MAVWSRITPLYSRARPTGPNHEAKQVASSKQLPTNQRGTDKAEKHEPN